MDNQQGPTAWHRELCSMLCGSLDGRGVWETMDTCICMAESLCCLPEIITMLLTCYSPKQSKKFNKKKSEVSENLHDLEVGKVFLKGLIR